MPADGRAGAGRVDCGSDRIDAYMRSPSFKVLTWHSCNVSDNTYAGND